MGPTKEDLDTAAWAAERYGLFGAALFTPAQEIPRPARTDWPRLVEAFFCGLVLGAWWGAVIATIVFAR